MTIRRSASSDRASSALPVLQAIFVLGDRDERNAVSLHDLSVHTTVAARNLRAIIARLVAEGLIVAAADGRVHVTAAGILALEPPVSKRG